MFSLNDSMRYWLYNRPTDMRKSYYTLSGIVTNELGCDPCNGDVYILMNKVGIPEQGRPVIPAQKVKMMLDHL